MTVAAALDIPAVQCTYTILSFFNRVFSSSPAPFNLLNKSSELKSSMG